MEICKNHKECFAKICGLCEDYEPLSSHAVLPDVGELLPCPFCGGEAKIASLGGDEENWCIYCPSCNCSCSEMGVSGETKNDIINAWNRRANFA